MTAPNYSRESLEALLKDEILSFLLQCYERQAHESEIADRLLDTLLSDPIFVASLPGFPDTSDPAIVQHFPAVEDLLDAESWDYLSEDWQRVMGQRLHNEIERKLGEESAT